MKIKVFRLVSLTVSLAMLLAPFTAGVSATPMASDSASDLFPNWALSSLPAQERPSSAVTVEWRDLPPDVQAKVDPRILAELRGEIVPAHLGGDLEEADVAPRDYKPLEKTRFLVYLKASANLETIAQQRFATRLEQRTAVFDALVSTAQATQGPIKTLLDVRMSTSDVASYQSFYIFNGFAVEGDLDTIIELAQRDDVERIVANYPLVLLSGSGKGAAVPSYALHPDNWNIDLVEADRVWDEFGITGEGAVVGGIDTGVDWTHPALQSQYRGYNAGGLGIHNHNYNWFDPDGNLYPGGDLGVSKTAAPFDNGAHGTHTMGTMVGDGGTPGTQVGMAPGARWIAISLNELSIYGNMGDDIAGHKTFQWMLCPTDLTGQLSTANCALAPDVVNNSWGSANPADDTFRPDIAALRAAGVAPVFAAGNPSAGSGSIGSPGSAPEAITVGATDSNDNVASFSGRGPSFYEGEQKPELSAPGVNINSTTPGGGYSGPTWSGTSMAAPAVAGLVALMVQADLQDGIRDFNVDELERFMEYTAVDLGPAGPDDDYGYGRIDAYGAVRWARSAGDLQGTITDQGTGMPIAGAVITGTKTNPGDTFTTESGGSGTYSTTVPAGLYDITVDAWGYVGDTFSSQRVITGALSIKNFALTAMPTAQLTGQVLSGTAPVSGALVYIADAPGVNYTTEASGDYTLTLPVGTHGMVVEATGYRVLREDVSVAGGGSSHDFGVTPAPTILLVEADTYTGWFIGWPVHNYFGWALDEENYLYNTWIVQYTTFTDTQVMADGSLGYGIPSTTTLGAYDLVIWAHGGGGFGTSGSTVDMGADDELMGYLDGGGRLILSGQDIGVRDDGTVFYDDYLHADLAMNAAAGEGETISGSGFWAGLDNLAITNASLHGYANGATSLSPDAVTPADGAAYPVMAYDNGNGSSVLAVDPCNADFRIVYWAIGFENIAPRAYTRDPDVAEALDRSIEWAMGSKPPYDVSVSATPARQTDAPGATVTYDVQVANTGAQTDTYTMTSNGVWSTCIYSGAVELITPIQVPPCAVQTLTLEVDIPPMADIGDEDTAAITATGTVSDSADVTTIAFPLWQIEPNAPYAASRVSLASWENSIYLMGGDDAGGPGTENYEFNACTGEWIARALIPIGTANHAAVALDGKIYVPGGNKAAAMNNLQIYDIASDTWSAGAPMPDARWANPAVVALNGEIYVVGGLDGSNVAQATTFVYSPTLDSWRTVTPMSEARYWVTGAALNGKLYVVGGDGERNTVEKYDPATDTWATKAPMLQGRAAAGATAVDGYLYVVGGGYFTYLPTAERYNPTTDTWEAISSLNTGRRTLGVAYAGGKIFAADGWNGSYRNDLESLQLFDAFCFSDKAVQQSAVQPGERITYTVEIHSDETDLPSASVTDPIPAGTTWAGFGINTIGATYNAGQDQVEWSGTIPAGSDPLTFTFGVDADLAGWTASDTITNEATFDSGAGLVFSRTVYTVLDFPDPAPSTKAVDKERALAGDVLTYTVHIRNASVVSDTFTMRDPIPANTIYVPGSLTYTLGTAGYDGVNDVITWTEELPEIIYVNTSGGYEWGDSDGSGDVPGVSFDWIDISSTGTAIGSGDLVYFCGMSIGFTFDFYGTAETTFCASTKGFVSFDTGGSYDMSNDCPLPSTNGNEALIAGIWDDLVVDGNIYYQTFGSASNRYTVIQWDGVRHYGSSTYFDFQIILYESDAIKVQILNAGPETGSGSTTGIEDYTETQGLTYACDSGGSIHDNLAVLFLPPGGALGDFSADVTFAVTTTAPLSVNTWITNTATITGPLNTVERSAGTLVNPVDLSASTKTANKAWAATGAVVIYDFVLENTGLLTATAMLTDPIPAHTAYVPGSVACNGTCGYNAGLDAITWNGDLEPGAPITLTFAVTLTDTLADLTPITNTATLDDGAGTLYELTDVFLARSPDLSHSFKQAVPDLVEPGGAVTYTVYVRNTGFVAGQGQVRDDLPPELTYVHGSVSCGSGSCGEASGVITWTGTVPARSMVPVRFQATVPPAASHGDLITNTATVTDVAWMTGYPAGVTVEVVEPADLWVTKSGAGDVEVRDTLVYTITYGNGGSYNAAGAAQVVDMLPADVIYVGSLPTGVYSAISGTVTWDVGALGAGVSSTLMLSISVPADTPPLTVLTNTVSISLIPQDLDAANNTAQWMTTVNPASNIYALRLAPVTANAAGVSAVPVFYTLQVDNDGNVADTFDVAVSGNTWATVAPATVGPLAAGEYTNLVVTVNISPTALFGTTDTATVTATSQGDPAQSASAILTTTSYNTYSVTLTSALDAQSGAPETSVTYTLRVTNTGNTVDTFNLNYAFNVWSASMPVTSTTLAAGEGDDVDVIVHIPASANDGDNDTVTIAATSQNDGSVSSSIVLTTTATVGTRYIYLPLVMRNSS